MSRYISVRAAAGLVLLSLLLLCLNTVQAWADPSSPFRIWAPYVPSPSIVFDGHIDTLSEWYGAGCYDISDLTGVMGDSVNSPSSVRLYVSHDSLYFRMAVANRVDHILTVGDIVRMSSDDNNNDEFDQDVDGKYLIRHMVIGGDTVLFIGANGPGAVKTDVAAGISAVDGYVCFEVAFRLGSARYWDIDSRTGQAFGAWIGVMDAEPPGDYAGVWPPLDAIDNARILGDVYLAMPNEVVPPASPSDVKVTVARPDTVVIDWVNPALDNVGQPLAKLDSVRIYRNDVLAHSIPTSSIGMPMNFSEMGHQLAKCYSYRLSAVTVFIAGPETTGAESPLTETRYAVPGYAYYTSDLEADNGGWVPVPVPPLHSWEWGEVKTYKPGHAHSGVKCWATDLDSSYGSNARWRLTGTPISIKDITVTKAALCFYHWYETEAKFDGGNVKVSTDNGTTWAIVVPEGGYPVDKTLGLDDEPSFGGASGEWQYAVFDLSDYVGETVKVRFDFGSDGSTEFFGWYVDDIDLIANSPEIGVREENRAPGADFNSSRIVVSPIPSNKGVSIAYSLYRPEKIGLYIYDLAGRRVATLFEGQQTAGVHQSLWDGNDEAGVSVSSGVYICRLSNGASFDAEKLLLIR
jgi:hypothetical protein